METLKKLVATLLYAVKLVDGLLVTKAVKTPQEALEHVSATTPLPPPEKSLQADLEALVSQFLAWQDPEAVDRDDWDQGFSTGQVNCGLALKKVLDKWR